MKIVLVGQKNGKTVIRWPQYLGLSLTLSLVMGIGSGAVFYLLAGQWSHAATLHGAGMGACIVGLGLVNGLRTSADKLTPLD